MASDRPGAGAPPPPPGYPTAGPSTAAPPPSSFPPPPPGYPGAAPQAAPYYGSYPAAAPPGAAPYGYNGYNAPPAYAYPPAAMAAGSSSLMTRPYQMPAKQNTGPWGGGGPVGSGVVPHDVEAQVMAAFADAEVRRGFQRKVLSIVTIQLLVTVGFACVCNFVNPIKNYVQSQPWPFYLAWALSFGLLLVISCNERLRRSHPINIILLGLFTLCEAFLVGMITCFFDIEIVLLAFICTLGAVMVLFAIASSKCVDLTGKASMLLVASTLLLILVLVGIFWVNTIWWLVISGIGALLASMYIVYDLQLIMGGKQYAISPDEYIFASLSLYLDIVQLFIWILYIIGIGKSM